METNEKMIKVDKLSCMMRYVALKIASGNTVYSLTNNNTSLDANVEVKIS